MRNLVSLLIEAEVDVDIILAAEDAAGERQSILGGVSDSVAMAISSASNLYCPVLLGAYFSGLSLQGAQCVE